jgi:two-component system sensor histidine kinase DegS
VLSFQLPAEALQTEAVNTCIYRTVQEALNNCEKHSGASEVYVTLAENSTGLQITIVDNGQGFAGTYSEKDHFGILGMRERAHMLGGDLQVESIVGQDTKVILNLPR